MSLNRMCLLAACAAVAALGGCERPPAAAPAPDAAQVQPPGGSTSKPSTDVFEAGSEPQIIKAVQKGTDFSGEPDLEWFTILQNIWYERSDTQPTFAWDVLKRPRVKLVVGSQLAQAYRNKFIPLNIEDIRRFALANYASEDSLVAGSSVILLGEAGNLADLPLLEQVARSGVAGRRMFKEAATAMVYICGDDAERALRELLVGASEDDRKFGEAWLNNREHIVASWCRG